MAEESRMKRGFKRLVKSTGNALSKVPEYATKYQKWQDKMSKKYNRPLRGKKGKGKKEGDLFDVNISTECTI